jgi:acetyl esterase/lipase
MTRRVEAYGPDPGQTGEWFAPDGDGSARTVVLIHGGFWREGYDRHLEDDLASALRDRGVLVWNVDYRPSTFPWPTTLTDVAAAADHLTRGSLAGRVDPSRVAVVGHSAGGHLALWSAGRHRLDERAPGAAHAGSVRPALAISQAGVAALTEAALAGVGGGAVDALCGGAPDDVPERYAVADPVRLLPHGIRSVLIHGNGDDIVPLSSSESFRDAAVAVGDDCMLRVLDGDHFIHLDPRHPAVEVLHQALETI